MFEGILLSFISGLLAILIYLVKDAYSNIKKVQSSTDAYVRKNTDSIIDMKTDLNNTRNELVSEMIQIKANIKINNTLLSLNNDKHSQTEKTIDKMVSVMEKQQKSVDNSLEKYGRIIEIIQGFKAKK